MGVLIIAPGSRCLRDEMGQSTHALSPGPAHGSALSMRASGSLALRACHVLSSPWPSWTLAGSQVSGSRKVGPAADQTAALGPPRRWSLLVPMVDWVWEKGLSPHPTPPTAVAVTEPSLPLPAARPCLPSLSSRHKQSIQPTLSKSQSEPCSVENFRKDDMHSPPGPLG